MIGLLILVVVLIVGVVGWTKMRRHGEASAPASDWTRTDEVFRDPSSGRLMRVWIDPADGGRHYVPE